MKKYTRIAIFILLIFLVLCAAGAILFLHFTPSPLQAYDLTDCTVGVYGYYSDKISCDLTAEETTEFVNCLQNAKVFPFEVKNIDGFSGGQENMYRISLKNGDVIELGIGDDTYLQLNGKWYRCDGDTGEYLNRLFLAYADEYFVPLTQNTAAQTER